MTEMRVHDQVPSGAFRRQDGIWVFPRREFVTTRFTYRAGQHIVFGGPSQNGKTTLAFDLLEECASETLPAYVIVSKPADPVSEKRGRELKYPRIYEGLPKRKLMEIINDERPRGYLIWPKFGDMNTDVENASRITRDFLNAVYAQGARKKKAILVLDDTYLKAKVLGLDRQMTTIHAMAGAMGIGAWTFVQKPTGAGETPIMAYGAADHLFLFNEPDERSRQRYGEIGGVNPKLVERMVMSLEDFQALYIRRSGRHMCIVDKA